MLKSHDKKSAFTLLEAAIVILVIGLIIAGIIGANYLNEKARIISAKSLTLSSPIGSIKDLTVWIEASTQQTTGSDRLSNGDQIASFDKISAQKTYGTVAMGSVKPTYTTDINQLPGIKFSGDTNSYISLSADFLKNSNYSIIVLEQRASSGSNSYFIGDSSISSSNQNLLLGYTSDNVIIHSQAGISASDNSNSYSATITDSAAYGTPKLIIFTSSATEGKKIYVNGSLVARSSNTELISNLSNLYIGKNYNGVIGELAIFDRSLTSEEIGDIARYISKKWNVKLSCASGDGSCGSSGGDGESSSTPTSCAVSISGSSTTSVSSGSGSITCDSGYTGSVTYVCSGGTASTSGSCTQITCSLAAGTGYSARSGLSYGTGSISCDSGYTGSISYNCGSSGSASVTGGSCTSSGGSGYYVTTSPFGSNSYTYDADFQSWFNSNGCTNSPSGVGSNPGGYSFSNGSPSTVPSGYVIWMSTATTKYWKLSSWHNMSLSTADFAANIAAIGCYR